MPRRRRGRGRFQSPCRAGVSAPGSPALAPVRPATRHQDGAHRLRRPHHARSGSQGVMPAIRASRPRLLPGCRHLRHLFRTSPGQRVIDPEPGKLAVHVDVLARRHLFRVVQRADIDVDGPLVPAVPRPPHDARPAMSTETALGLRGRCVEFRRLQRESQGTRLDRHPDLRGLPAGLLAIRAVAVVCTREERLGLVAHRAAVASPGNALRTIGHSAISHDFPETNN